MRGFVNALIRTGVMGDLMTKGDTIEFSLNDLFSKHGFDSGQKLSYEIFAIADDMGVNVHNEDEILYEVIKAHFLDEVCQGNMMEVGFFDCYEGGINPVRAVRVDGEEVDLADSHWHENRGLQLKPTIVHVDRDVVLDTIRWALAVQNADIKARVSNSKGGKLAARIIGQIPEFAKEWEVGLGSFISDNYTVSPCATMALLSRLITRRFMSGDIEGMDTIFELLEVLLNDHDYEIGSDAGVCCLEKLVDYVPKLISQDVFCRWLGPESRKLCRAFGVRCEV